MVVMGKQGKSTWVFAGLVAAMAALSAVPGVVKAVHLPGPAWMAPVMLAVAAVLLGAVKPRFTVINDASVARTKDTVAQDEGARRSLQGLPAPKTVAETDPTLLGIHPSIPLPAGAQGSLSPDLPEYVVRDIDADLRTYLRARSAKGGFALLVGPAAAGKTRSAWEAIFSTLPGWQLLRPNPGGDMAWAQSRKLGRSVIWLNEIQDFLTGAAPLEAATVRRLLADTDQPVILIGTIWADRHAQLRTIPATPPEPTTPSPAPRPAESADTSQAAGGLAEQQPNAPGRNEKDVLEQARIFSLTAFTEAEWERARELAGRDPRLAHATANSGTSLGLTQVLSAAPELILSWEQADNPYGKALITGAVTARRCGHPPTIPTSILQALANHYLTGQQRADAPANWLQQGLAWACQPVHHSQRISPLAPHGDQPGQTDGHRVTDILTNHTAPTSPAPTAAITPDEVWNTLIAHAAPDAQRAIGRAAYYVERMPQAADAWTRAADAGNTNAMYNLGFLANDQGDTDTARTRWTQAADAGDTDAMGLLGILADERGDTDTARTWYTQAADAGNTNAMTSLGFLAR
ncbi:Tetratricopeptide repeat-containing protein, partial [Streptomyces sp. SolWspMP-5a-2]